MATGEQITWYDWNPSSRDDNDGRSEADLSKGVFGIDSGEDDHVCNYKNKDCTANWIKTGILRKISQHIGSLLSSVREIMSILANPDAYGSLFNNPTKNCRLASTRQSGEQNLHSPYFQPLSSV